MTLEFHRLARLLKRHEGYRGRPYKDTEGHWTVGYGHLIGDDLEDLELPETIWTSVLYEDMGKAARAAKSVIPTWNQLDAVRQEVLANMAYNLGQRGLAGFRRMIAAVVAQDWERAADEMLDSRWAHQVGARSRELADMMRTGEYPAEVSG